MFNLENYPLDFDEIWYLRSTLKVVTCYSGLGEPNINLFDVIMKLNFCNFLRNSFLLMELEGPLPSSKYLYIGSYIEPNESSPHSCIGSCRTCNIVIPYMPMFCLLSWPIRYPAKTCMHFSHPTTHIILITNTDNICSKEYKSLGLSLYNFLQHNADSCH